VFAIAARAQMRGDPLASGKYLDGTAGESRTSTSSRAKRCGTL
jgi:hypothetical protein